MGVPSFYRWLVRKYPNVVVAAKEEEDAEVSPNGVYDNLYLDMNGIIHQCFHPEDQVLPPTTYNEVFESMFEYMDRLFRIVRPRKLLYMAVDGVAPRAKMNQKRARRFKAAKDAQEAEVEENLLRDKYRAEGKEVLPREVHEVSDSNVPGTEFMEKLSNALQYYIGTRLNGNPGWKGVMVILSDANVPGEGEHKIMSFIRAQRGRENYDPNTRHCLYGLDADLIMLALASHEVHFSILCEDVLTNLQENCVPLVESFFITEGSAKVMSRGWFPQATEIIRKRRSPKKPYQFLNIWTLREYLELDMNIPKTDIEKLIDDFVFICFLTGNDFIPHIPSLEIHEYAVDLLIETYKASFNKMGGYIIDTDKLKEKHAAYLKVSRLEKFVHELSLYEEKIFAKRYDVHEKMQRKMLRQASENEWTEDNFNDAEESSNSSMLIAKSFSTKCSISDVRKNILDLRQDLKNVLRNKQDLFKSGGAFKHDRVRLGLPGWKSRFYNKKFGAETSVEVTRLQTEMVQKYLEGLCWVLQYYYVGVVSWSWYYPFYYAPFASDLRGLSRFKISFNIGKPLRPFDQLMAVLPPQSSSTLPKAYRKLMSCDESAIQKFYPSEDLEIDTDGKRFMWQAIVKLPFIDEELLLSATKMLEKDLESYEVKRNTIRQEKIFLRNSHALANNAAFLHISDSLPKKCPIDSAVSEIGGWLSTDEDGLSTGFFHVPIENMNNTVDDETIPEPTKLIPRLLHGITMPERTVTEADISSRQLWHEYPGPKPPVTYNVQNYPYNRPATFRRSSDSPAMPREEFKGASVGWMGKGRGCAIGETRRSSLGTGHGNLAHGRGVSNNGGSCGGYPRSFWTRGRTEKDTVQDPRREWRPVQSPATAGSSAWRGRGQSGQHRAW